MNASPPIPRRIADIDWSNWRAVDPATLVFVIQGDRILLIRKKRGLGAGKINGPGGRLEASESIQECAIRETREELGITPTGLQYAGDSRFQFLDGYSIHVHTFRADGYSGTLQETAEAVPLWFSIEQIPYDEMWQDDQYWLPLMLQGKRFSGCYIFDGDAMLDYRLDVID